MAIRILTVDDPFPTRAEIEAGPVCPRCGKKCGMSQEDYDAIIHAHAKTLARAVEDEIVREVFAAVANPATLSKP